MHQGVTTLTEILRLSMKPPEFYKLPQDEAWTDSDGPSWIQYDLFHKNKLPGSKNVNLAKFMLRAYKLH